MQFLIPLDRIQNNPWQTRQGEPDPEYLKALAMDIAANGLLQYPVGRLIHTDGTPVSQSGYDDPIAVLGAGPATSVQLAFGHNRLAAYRWLHEFECGDPALNWDSMPVDLRALTDEQMAIMAWSENEKRRDHTPYERALAIQKRMDDFNWTQAQVAEHLGMSRPAVSNSLRLLKLPQEVLESLAGGQISERQAMALITLYDLPERLRQRAESGYGIRPSTIVRETLRGEYTSDKIRDAIVRICLEYGRNLEEASWGLDDFFPPEQVHAVACRDCELRLKDRNLCQDPKCYELKGQITRRTYLEKASQACGYPPLENENYSYGQTTAFVFSKEKYLESIQHAGCPNLRVMFDPHVREGKTADEAGYVPGFPKAKIVCNKREQFCTCLKGLEALEAQRRSVSGKNGGQPVAIDDETDDSELPGEPEIQVEEPSTAAFAPDAEELKELARAARKEKREAQQEANAIIQEVGERIATGLAMKNLSTWRKMAKKVHYEISGESIWDIQVAIGKHIADGAMPYEIKRLEDITDRMDQLLKECGLEPLSAPKALALEEVEPVFENPEGKPLIELWANEAENEPIQSNNDF